MEQQVEEKTTEETKEMSIPRRVAGIISEVLLYALIIVICTCFVPRYVMAKTVVDGSSMERTLQDEDQLLLDKITYRVAAPKRYDVIVFYHFFDMDNQDRSDEDAYDFYVKRVIGLPGETVQIIDGSIYVNGKVIEDTHAKDVTEECGRAEQPITLGEDEYFVLGDNREVSIDSRDERVGNVKRDWIAGKVRARVFPVKDISLIR